MEFKKILTILIALLVLPIYVKADMSMPNLIPYEIVVTNKDGAQCYDFQGKQTGNKKDYNTKYYVQYEINNNETIFLNITSENEDDMCYLNENDVSTLNNFDYKKMNRGNKEELYVFKEGAILYKGPSEMFDKVDMKEIPVGTTLTYEYSDDLWAYVTYKGKSGYLLKDSIYNGISTKLTDHYVCTKEENELIVVKPKIELYKEPDFNSEKEIVDIPLNTILDSDKKIFSGYASNLYYIKYGEKEGWVLVYHDSDSSIVSNLYLKEGKFDFFSIDITNVYDSIENKNIIGNLEKNKEYSSKIKFVYYETDARDYEGDVYYYVSIGDIKGWINTKTIIENYGIKSLYTMNDINVYSDSSLINKIGTVKKGTIINNLYDAYKIDEKSLYYIITDNFEGYIEDMYLARNSSECMKIKILDKNGIKFDNNLILPYNTEIDVKYTYQDYNNKLSYRIFEFKGKYYELNITDNKVAKSMSGKYTVVKDSKKIKVYDSEDLDNEIDSLPLGAEFESLYEYNYDSETLERTLYIKYNGKKGWIRVDVYNDDRIKSLYYDNSGCESTDTNIIANTNKTNKKEDKQKKSFTTKEIIIMSIAGAIIVSLTGLVTLKLINKKKKMKNNIETNKENE